MIKINGLKKSFNNNQVLKGIDLIFNEKEVVSIIGESGSGKSTLLRCINLLENYDEGKIMFLGKDIKDYDINNLRSNVGMVFQQFNLFNNLNVIGNCTIGLIKVQKLSKKEAEIKAIEKLNLVGMGEFLYHNVNSLSGGQKQRVAIARALCLEPKVILFDEPTSALDPKNVNEVLNVIRNLAKSGITMIIVTHEMKFAREISDRIIYVDKGIIEIDDTPEAVFSNTENESIKSFLQYS
ncbi:MAG: amino acid ABC transporter ATP-binding protein [Bacilli bacterium]